HTPRPPPAPARRQAAPRGGRPPPGPPPPAPPAPDLGGPVGRARRRGPRCARHHLAARPAVPRAGARGQRVPRLGGGSSSLPPAAVSPSGPARGGPARQVAAAHVACRCPDLDRRPVWRPPQR